MEIKVGQKWKHNEKNEIATILFILKGSNPYKYIEYKYNFD